MFDFAWTELAVIGVVALIAIGPKDLPVAIKAVTGAIKKARKMAGEFQTHVDEMVREADLGAVRDKFNEIRNFDIKSEIEKAVDSDGSLAKTFSGNPLEDTVNANAATPLDSTSSDIAAAFAPPAPEPLDAAALAIPAFVPPQIAMPPAPPDFLPPGTTLAGRA
jgi:sec-independent protein translocase protein TatB